MTNDENRKTKEFRIAKSESGREDLRSPLMLILRGFFDIRVSDFVILP